MRKLSDILMAENKKEDEHRAVFKETDPTLPFPNDTIAALKREINTGAKDLEIDWPNTIELVDHAFKVLKVPKPKLSQKSRWDQYNTLIAYAVRQLYDARGPAGSWRSVSSK